jgi:hypothetical protein
MYVCMDVISEYVTIPVNESVTCPGQSIQSVDADDASQYDADMQNITNNDGCHIYIHANRTGTVQHPVPLVTMNGMILTLIYIHGCCWQQHACFGKPFKTQRRMSCPHATSAHDHLAAVHLFQLADLMSEGVSVE